MAVLALSILAIALGGLVPQTTIQIIDGKSHLSSVQVVGNAPLATLPINGNWTTTDENMIITGGNFSGILPLSDSPIATFVEQDMDVNISTYQILNMQVNVSTGTNYGIRFMSFSTPLWNETDVLNHRVGTGQPENIQMNMQLHTNQSDVEITSVLFYVERSASNTSSSYSVQISEFNFESQSLTVYSPNETGSYRAIYIQLSSLTSDFPLNRVNIGLSLKASDGTRYQSYLIDTEAIYKSYGYSYRPLFATYDYTLYPGTSTANSFIYVIPPVNDSALTIALAVIPGQGAFTQLSVDYINLYYIPSPAYVPPAQSNLLGLGLYPFIFTFMIPIVVALVLYQSFFKRKKLTKRNAIFLTLFIGGLCRLCLAPFTIHPLDSEVFAIAARAWYQYGTTSGIIGPTFPYTFFLQWIPYSLYALMQMVGLQDLLWLGHQVGLVENLFLKVMPIISDFITFFILLKFVKNEKYIFLAVLFFLNPLCIYLSSVWGQYEMLVAMFMVLGLFFGNRKEHIWSSVAFATSIATGLLGAIPFGLNVISNIWKRENIKKILLMFAPLLIIVLYWPEIYYIFVDLMGVLGLSPVFSQVSGTATYTLVGNIPFLGPLLLVILTISLIAVFIWRKDFSVQSITLFTIIETLAIIMCSRSYPQFWLYLVPLTAVYSIMAERESLSGYMFVFGIFVAFGIMIFTQGLDYMLLGVPGNSLFPFTVNIGQALNMYIILTTILGILIIPYLFKKNGDILRTALQTVALTFGVLIVAYIILNVVI